MPNIVIIGSENVGKSTLFNALSGSTEALTCHVAGTTRDRRISQVCFRNEWYNLVDTGGLFGSNENFTRQVTSQTEKAIAEADLIYLVLKAHCNASSMELELARTLRKASKLVILVLNYLDLTSKTAIAAANFYSMGIPHMVPVSAKTGTGIESLKELTQMLLPGSQSSVEEKAYLTVALVGRPNTGKSTFINYLLGEDRVIASDKPGTTTDSIISTMYYKDLKINIVDTAGIKRMAKICQLIEKLAISQTFSTLPRAEAVILLIDGTQGVTHQDLTILDKCVQTYRRMSFLAINKCDTADFKENSNLINDLTYRCKGLYKSNIYCISAKTGMGISKLLDQLVKSVASSRKSISTNLLTTCLQNAVAKKPTRAKLKLAHLGGLEPFKIIIHGNNTHLLSKDYKAYLENCFRALPNIGNAPLQIIFRVKS